MTPNSRKIIGVLGWLAVCTSTPLLPGCVVIPVPVRHIPQRDFERNVDEHSTLPLTIGRTTRKEVLLSLGQPDGVMDGERRFFYTADATKEGVTWRFIIIAASPSAGAGAMALPDETSGPQSYEKYRLTIWFDEKGIVRDHKFERAR